VGFVLIVSPADVATVVTGLQTAGEQCFEIGEVVAGEPGVDYV
jgi:phosphoribosylaminoimidazole (AIR) synthetase